MRRQLEKKKKKVQHFDLLQSVKRGTRSDCYRRMMNWITSVLLAVVITHTSTPHLIVYTYKYSLANVPPFHGNSVQL